MLNKVQSLNALRTFEVCARVESVQEAANLLHVTPSAVSHQLRKLEQEIGIELFIRSHRKITPTEKGRALQAILSKAFTQISDTISELSEREQAELVINVLPVFSIRWLNPRLLRFFNRHPEVDLTIKNSYRVEDLSQTKCDLAIRWGTGSWPGVICEKLFDEYALPALSPKLIQATTLKREQDLLDLPLIQIFEGADHWEEWAKSHQRPLTKKLKYIKFNDPSAALQAAIDGLGVVLGPISLLHNELQNGSLIAPFGRPINTHRAYYLARPKQANANNPRLEKFAHWIREEAKIFEDELLNTYSVF